MICLTVTVDCQKIKQISTAPTMAADVAEIKEMSIVKICNESSSRRREIAFISQSAQYGRHKRVLLLGVKRDANRNECILRASTYYAGRVYCIINELYETTITGEINSNI